ncbi:endonuclease MutS2 [Leptotrichia buccalis]|uniref:Endonuclease MutS2 n=1 Tax=Leptotrichia buccalis (strain ATCC 14201 / DSM 1135 / JCM 12969 / NCTC 10249 / C-1013-b) TaxID=523794 RepID=C7ND86_LEPBD|nr:endonuclease MutS2 [Leptotrichia buccalis]ACV39964.1 MutS2 family protein [Leptotrichia buccalis C-1013-b]
MEKNYDVLEFYKIVNELIDLSRLEKTKEKFLDIDIIKEKSVLDKELMLMMEMIDFYKYDDGLELAGLANITKMMNSIDIIGSYLSAEDLAVLKKNLTIFRISKSRAKNVRDKYRTIWNLFSDVEEVKDIENFISEAINDEGVLKDEASIGLRDVRRQKQNINANIKEKFDELISNKSTQNAIQERIITQRNDRYVIAVKTDFKGLIKGIEHDRSATGSTVYIEPLNVVSLNNKLREYEAREREEIRKILLRLTELVKTKKEEILEIKEILERLDFIDAKTTYSVNKKCIVPKIINKEYLKLVEARHPLIGENTVVPINFELGNPENIMLITGPNTGGKTVTLKVAGLLTIMALSGIPIPANEKTEIGYFHNVLADIGDEQSLEQNLSSFSGHVSKIKDIIENANSKSLVLMDELGSGTDPMEGAAFAMAIIDYLNKKHVTSIITTHYSEVKAYAFNTTGIKSASMEFNVETLSPTYRLLEGIPGESNALIIARKYGISEEVIENAKSYISEDNQRVEEMLKSIKEKNDELETMQAQLEATRTELDKQKSIYEQNMIKLENEKNEIIKRAYEEADNYLKNMQAKAKNLIDKINSEESKKEDAKNAQRSLNMLRESFITDKKKNVKEKKVVTQNVDFAVGEEVLVKTMNQNGKILKIMPNNRIQVQTGILKLVVSTDDIVKIQKKKTNKFKNFASLKRTSQVRGEIDLRGMNADEAIAELETYMDRAMLTGYHEIYIIHGKGTMVLRKKIHEYLRTSKYVTEFKDANQNEGGIGCTVVILK